jgi:hypothetical protein
MTRKIEEKHTFFGNVVCHVTSGLLLGVVYAKVRLATGITLFCPWFFRHNETASILMQLGS